MIQEVKIALSGNVTPEALANDDMVVDVTGNYDWNAQSYCYDACKFGTSNQTSIGTRSMYNNFDSYND